jgi:hypothetical protein
MELLIKQIPMLSIHWMIKAVWTCTAPIVLTIIECEMDPLFAISCVISIWFYWKALLLCHECHIPCSWSALNVCSSTSDLTRKNSPTKVQWRPQCDQAFGKLKHPPTLYIAED